jgi:hypothetical protein
MSASRRVELASAFRLRPHAAQVALPRVRPSARAPTGCCFRRARSAPTFESDKSISVAASLRRPTCESGLCHFRADRYFPLFARLRRLARANGPKPRRVRTGSKSLGGNSVAKSRTVGSCLESQRQQGRRLFLPGWGAGIRTPEWRYQKPLPYHLATPQCRERAESYAIRARKATVRIGPVLTQLRSHRTSGWTGFGRLFRALRANRKAAIGPAPSEYSSAW